MEGVYRDSYVRSLVHPKTQNLKSLFGADIMANRLNIYTLFWLPMNISSSYSK